MNEKKIANHHFVIRKQRSEHFASMLNDACYQLALVLFDFELQ